MKPNLPVRVIASKRVQQVFATGTQDNLAYRGSDTAQRGQHRGVIIRMSAQRLTRNVSERTGNLRSRPRLVTTQLQLEDTPPSDERSVTDKEEEISLHRSRDVGSSGTNMGDSRGREKPRDSGTDTQHQDSRRIPQVRLSKREQQLASQKSSLVAAGAGAVVVTQAPLQTKSVVDTALHSNFLSPTGNLLQYATTLANADKQSQLLFKLKLYQNPSAAALLITRDFIANAAAVLASEIGLAEIRELLMSASLSKSVAQHTLSSSERSRRILLPLQMLMATAPRRPVQRSVAVARLDLLARSLSFV